VLLPGESKAYKLGCQLASVHGPLSVGVDIELSIRVDSDQHDRADGGVYLVSAVAFPDLGSEVCSCWRPKETSQRNTYIVEKRSLVEVAQSDEVSCAAWG
jgi:hypothetical protein